MIIIRLILFCLLVLMVYGVIRLVRRQPEKPRIESREEGTMVPCAHCDLHVPQDQAIQVGDLWYCSEEHRQAADGEPR